MEEGGGGPKASTCHRVHPSVEVFLSGILTSCHASSSDVLPSWHASSWVSAAAGYLLGVLDWTGAGPTGLQYMRIASGGGPLGQLSLVFSLAMPHRV